MINVGSNPIQGIFLGSKPVKSVRRGSRLIWSGGILPDGYTRCSFVAPKLTGKLNYFDTGIYMDKECEVYIDFAINQYNDQYHVSANGMLYGSRSAPTSANFSCLVSINKNVQFDFGDYSKNRYTLYAPEHERYTAVINNECVKVDGVTVFEHKTVNAFKTPGTCLIFSGSGNMPSGTKYPVDANVYAFRISKSGEAIVDYIPAVRDSDGIVGFYDLVSKQFITGLIPEEFYTED